MAWFTLTSCCCCRTLSPLRRSGLLEEVFRFNGAFKGFTWRANRNTTGLLSFLRNLPHISHIEPDFLFYPSLARGEDGTLMHNKVT
jgi:hypothetical protein